MEVDSTNGGMETSSLPLRCLLPAKALATCYWDQVGMVRMTSDGMDLRPRGSVYGDSTLWESKNLCLVADLLMLLCRVTR